MKLKLFQKQDLARAALHDGLILSWDTGLGKTWALFLWPLLKVGYDRIEDPTAPGGWRIQPRAPILVIAPGDLHDQIRAEGWKWFRVRCRSLDSQESFMELARKPFSPVLNLDDHGRPILPPGFYITSYTQLTTNGVAQLPNVDKWDPEALREFFCLPIGEHMEHVDLRAAWDSRPSFATVCEFFAWRGIRWRNEYHRLGLHPDDTLDDLRHAYGREMEILRYIRDDKLQDREIRKLNEAREALENLFTTEPCPRWKTLAHEQQMFVLRHFLDAKVEEYSAGMGQFREYRLGPEPASPSDGETVEDTRPIWRVKCLYSPSLSDLAYDAFDTVVIDEGVKMKGEDTLVGMGVRQMRPKHRLVLTATPVKNRLPDIFRLAWWASGGLTEAHARWPYRDDSSERTKFAETFMVSERNLTKEKKAQEEALRTGSRVQASRFVKLTAEVCNVHKLWKLFGPIVLRRRKDDCGEDIVPKIRKVIRCEMGTQQHRVYRYHLNASYVDKNGMEAVGAKLQALRVAAADPSSEHLRPALGNPSEPCTCRNGERATCRKCGGSGKIPLPPRSGTAFIPKMATTLTLIREILDRKEQVVVFSAFNDPLDKLGGWLDEAGVRYCKLDGRVTQKRRGKLAAVFKRGRSSGAASVPEAPVPVMLAGVECMAEGHSFHLANNVILIAYSWAYDKFIQAINRVHRMTSEKPVNVYVVLCNGTIDAKLESLIGDKGDAAELVLDGRLIGERTEEVNLAELLRVAEREFDANTKTIDEAELIAQWPALKEKLTLAMRAWDPVAVSEPVTQTQNEDMRRTNPIRVTKPQAPTLQTPVTRIPVAKGGATARAVKPVKPASIVQVPPWRQRMQERAALLARVQKADLWASL